MVRWAPPGDAVYGLDKVTRADDPKGHFYPRQPPAAELETVTGQVTSQLSSHRLQPILLDGFNFTYYQNNNRQ